MDLHGEYCWKTEDNKLKAAFDNNVMRYVDARDLEIPYWLLTYSELIDLLIDREDPGASTQIAYLREVLLVLRKKANTHLDIERLSVDSPVFFSLPELYMHFKKANEQQTDFGKTKGALFGQFDEFLVKLQSKLNDARYDFLFKPKRRTSSESLETLLKDFTGLTEPKRQVTVVDLSPVPSDVRPVVAAQLGRLAFEFNYWNPKRKDFPLQLICEEAHNYIPREHATKYHGARISMERIAKEGRKYGVGLTVVSQRPHELSETVLSQCSNYICMRLTNPDDQTYVRSLVPEGETDLVNTLSSLARGEALILGEAIPLPTRFQVTAPSPTPNSQDADYYSEWSTEPFDLDVAKIVDNWRRQTR
jgi:DNA helicase HerA-like ATPase